MNNFFLNVLLCAVSQYINVWRILGCEMKLSQFHGQHLNNWLPYYFSLADLIRLHGSQHDSRAELFIGTVCTIGLVYRLSVNILQSILRLAVRYIGNKLFLRELRRLTDRSRASYYCRRVVEAYCASLSRCFSFFFFLLLSFLDLRRLVLFSTAIHVAIT